LAGLALGLLIAYLVLAFGLRVAIQLRRTGETGLVGLTGEPLSREWVGGVLFGCGMIAGGLSPILVAAGATDPIENLEVDILQAVGVALAAFGIVGTFVAQLAMGASWRIGIDHETRTALVTNGVFALVRNPIYTAMFASWIGLALMLPTWPAIVAVPLVFVGLELQVRFGEEPYLARTHGDAYRDYARRVGRFLPGLGRGT
jgi:protein-S-isoprenylcysteine O-methyltransferase Ste14